MSVGANTYCICCCRRKREHRHDGMCPEPSYFIPNEPAKPASKTKATPA